MKSHDKTHDGIGLLKIFDRDAVLKGATHICQGLFEDPAHPELLETPRRFTDYLEEFSQPVDLKEVLKAESQFAHQANSTEYPTLVTQFHIPFRAICAHHLLPFFGEAAVGYIPRRKVVGLSKLTRLVQTLGTRSPSIQEGICENVVDALMHHVEAAGAICVIKATHTCMSVRGACAPTAVTTTASIRGLFRDNAIARNEFYSLMQVS